MKYGLYDKAGNCWIGNKLGPLTYENKALAQMA
ncbi:unnamed protein product, partial [marine sediment metagenome]